MSSATLALPKSTFNIFRGPSRYVFSLPAGTKLLHYQAVSFSMPPPC